MPLHNDMAVILGDQTSVVSIIIVGAMLAGIVAASYGLYRGYENLARRSLVRKLADLQIHSEPQPGDVILTYHTYHGLLLWVTQTRHDVVLPPDDARRLLGRLFRFNLTWGLVTYGAALIPPLAICNYFAQGRSITRQEAAGGYQPGEATSDDELKSPFVEPSRAGKVVMGWVMAALSVIFAVSAVMSTLQGEFGAAIGGALFAVVLGALARDWIGKRRTKAA
jgi:hypothetical protein